MKVEGIPQLPGSRLEPEQEHAIWQTLGWILSYGILYNILL